MSSANKCCICGSDNRTCKDCNNFTDVMAKENGHKAKKDWKPPKRYKSALGKARALAKEKTVKP